MLLAFQADDFAASRIVGSLVGILLPVTFLVQAIRSLSESDQSRRCALALLLAAGGWALCSLTYALTQLSDAAGGLLAFAAVPAAIAMVVAVVLAISGLVELAGDRAPSRGKGQAIGALVIAPLFIAGAIYGFLNSDRNDIPKELQLPQPPAGAKLPFTHKGFSYTVPGNEWVRVNSVRLNPLAEVAFAHSRKKIFFVVIAENMPAGAYATQEMLLEASRGELLKVDPTARVGPSQPETVGTLQGHGFSVDARTRNMSLNYRYWVHAAGNRVYQLVAWGPQSSSDLVTQSSKSLVQGFGLLGP
jgi:hypothetical protein